MQKKKAATKARKSRKKTWTIVVHARFHFDELVGIVLLMLYGEKLFPGIHKARVAIVDNPQTVNAKKELENRRICIGCGGGMFDEHGLRNRVTCCAELVADKLGIRHHAIRRLLDQVIRCDNDSGVDELHIASIIKRLHRRMTADEVLQRTFEIVRDLIAEEMAYEDAFQSVKFAKATFDLSGSGRRIRAAVVRSDNPYAATVCRNKGAQIVMVITPTGNIQVITDERARVDLTEVARLLRMSELAKRKKRFKFSGDYLRESGKLKECPWWYFFSKRGQFLLNGSNQSSPSVEPTVLEPREVLRAIMVGTRERETYREPGRINRLKKIIAERSKLAPVEIAERMLERYEQVQQATT